VPTLTSIAKNLLKTQKKQTKLEKALKKELRELIKENKNLSKARAILPLLNLANNPKELPNLNQKG